MSADTESHVYEAPPGPNEWEQRMLEIADADGVIAACSQASAETMRWTCEQAGHPTQNPDDTLCICETWSRHITAGAVVIDCEPTDESEATR